MSKRLIELPSTPRDIESDLRKYITLIYGREGIGKSTFFASFPGIIFFSTEPGTAGLEVLDFNWEEGGVTSWEIFQRGVELLVKEGPGRIKNVVIDTIDRAYDLCNVYICKELGIAHVGEDKSGKSDRSGKGWSQLKKEFVFQLYRLTQAGFGLGLTSHMKMTEIESHSGDKYNVIIPSMSGQAFGVVRAITAYIFYAEYIKDTSGDTQRILITEGDELITAKHRGEFPRFIKMEEDNGYQVFKDAFDGKDIGLDPSDFNSSKKTSKVGQASIKKTQMDNARKPGKKVVAKKKVAKKVAAKKKSATRRK